ncbi:acylphosphatase [Noviherbaspirillum massiliense]|uniref:acylphosphatase n=1 Tax=Noviherbaspirillum massiliense TaxID=1465823 RepID=UPI00030FE778|nr:acylphosphatase [Noviherbaspirillum massiliense]
MAKHLIITGIVQGVGYRAAFEARARALGLSGWVRNRRDGSVEAMVAGKAESLQAIVGWAWQGPAAARVSDVSVRDADDARISEGSFEQLPTC